MFAKLFQSMYDGTLGTRGPWEALVTFQQMLILADRFGDVDMTIEVIQRRTQIPLEILTRGVEELLKPDPDSRDTSERGRRIVPLEDSRSWGWHIVNYGRYSQIRSAEERREYKANWYREQKAGKTTTQEPKPATPTKEKGNGEDKEVSGAAVWVAYETAYRARWGVAPARNAKTNALCKRFAGTLPAAEAPLVIRFFLQSNRGLYVAAKHDLALALRDAQALRTEWMRGEHGTDAGARQGDRTAARYEAFRPMIEEANQREGGENGKG